jgi:hypothetical protein
MLSSGEHQCTFLASLKDDSASANEPIPVFVLSALPRPRNLTLSNTSACESQSHLPICGFLLFLPLQGSQYRARRLARDRQCLTGLRTQTYTRLKAAHLFSRAHDRKVSKLSYLYRTFH